LLLVGAVVVFAGFLVMLLVFTLSDNVLFHWGLGPAAALACGGVLPSAAIARRRDLRTGSFGLYFPTTLAELKRDREWLTHKAKKKEKRRAGETCADC